MPGFSFLVTLLMGLGAWCLRGLRTSAVGVGLALGMVMAAAGVGADVGWLVDIGVVAAAVALGVVIGRAIPGRAAPMALLLGMLSLVDIIWIGSGGGSSTVWGNDVLNFSVDIGTSTSTIGTLDLILAASLAAHWLKRGAGIVLSVAAAPLGMLSANLYVALIGAENLPLLPFITFGWLLTEGIDRYDQNRRQRRT